jgi:hypothetical protein
LALGDQKLALLQQCIVELVPLAQHRLVGDLDDFDILSAIFRRSRMSRRRSAKRSMRGLASAGISARVACVARTGRPD